MRPLNLRVEEFIRANPPLDMPEDRMNRALDILESPGPRREEMMLRDWFESDEHEGAALSHFLIEEILDMASNLSSRRHCCRQPGREIAGPTHARM